MEQLSQHHEAIAMLIARVFLGVLFLFQGYDAVFNIKIKNIIHNYEDSFQSKGIPKFLTILGTWFTSCTELVGGFLLITGFLKYYALFLLGADLIVASIAFGIAAPMWDMRHAFPRLALLLLLLILPSEWDIYTLDHLFFKL
ncbi:MAG TPA: DoxX family protein [Bacteroidia bacterium]|nr:DoxX family protein [Bacteroidia bacterium]